jgi:hypothetical protein
MIRQIAVLILVLCGCVHAIDASEFEAPVIVKAGDKAVRVESPGYAAPCWADVDHDGKKDLLVGQFNGGKIHVYKNLGDGKLADGKWLQAGGADASVPGVW